MKIVKAKHAGFCYGVQRATEMAFALKARGIEPIFTMGPLIHNPQEVSRLASFGIVQREKIDDCRGGKTIIRTHGISREELKRANSLGVDLVDATCPHVKVPRRHIEAFGNQGRTVLVVGDHDHPEVKALLSYATGPVVACKPGELPDLPPKTPVGIIAQTTQSTDAFRQVIHEAHEKFQDIQVANTICRDTELRQEEGRQLASLVDLMIVVGGRNSANTLRLTEICRLVQPKSYQIETMAELSSISFSNVVTVGVTSGASTPDWIIAEVMAWLDSLVNASTTAKT